jgi:fatty-acid desaturase
VELRRPGSWLLRALEPPSYGYVGDDGALVVPTAGQLVREMLWRLDPRVSGRKAWLPLWSWSSTLVLSVPLAVFFAKYFSLPLLLLGFAYGMVALGTHGTIWLHRYATHRAFKLRNPLARTLLKHAVIKIVNEEAYVVSHHVHHLISEQPGDPYNVNGGWLYCFLADVNHQLIARELDEKDYARVARLVADTGVRPNDYAGYLRWGSISHPLPTVLTFAANWAFWYGAFWLIGGHALATAMFGGAFVWALGVRTFNFDGHGAGKDKRRDGIDFHRDDKSINQLWPGFVAGEWHNNHHLFPNGARSGFLWYQLDLAWIVIRSYAAVGGIVSYRDPKAQFLKEHYAPWLIARGLPASAPPPSPAPPPP